MVTGAASDLPGRTFAVEPVREVLHLLGRRGVDVQAVLSRSGLPEELLLGSEPLRVGAEPLQALLRELWRSTGDELMGLGRCPVPLGSFRLLAFAMHGGRRLVDHLDRFVELQGAIPGFPDLAVSTGDGHLAVGFATEPGVRTPTVVTSVLLSMMHGYMSWAVGASVPLVGIELPDDAGPRGAEEFRSVFGAPVRLGSPHPRLLVDASWLDAPTTRSEDDLRLMVQDSMLRLVLRTFARPRASDAVRQYLATRGTSGELPTVTQIATALHVSPQTLRRRLRDEGTSPRQVREELMRDVAIAALSRGDQSVASIGRRLGFAEPSTFSRAFRRWTGTSPGAYSALTPAPRPPQG